MTSKLVDRVRERGVVNVHHYRVVLMDTPEYERLVKRGMPVRLEVIPAEWGGGSLIFLA